MVQAKKSNLSVCRRNGLKMNVDDDDEKEEEEGRSMIDQ